MNTKTPCDVDGSPSSAPSGVCRKKPFVFTPVTTPLVSTYTSRSGDVGPLPWISWISAGTGVQLRRGAAELRGTGLPTEKSTTLLSESKQPARFRSAASRIARARASAPFLRGRSWPRSRRNPCACQPPGTRRKKRVVESRRATLPAPAAMAIVPVASGVGSGVEPPVPAASWTK